MEHLHELRIKDPYFQVQRVSCSPNPNQLIYAAMHQDYAEGFVWAERESLPSEEKAGELIIKHLLNGNRGHYGPLEHPQITFNCGWFPHSVMQQIRTHRVGVSFDVQSFRYTGKRLIGVAMGMLSAEEVFYLRPPGAYSDRHGKRYTYTQAQRDEDLTWCIEACRHYAERVQHGFSEEHARGLIPFDVRQHFVLSCNVRSLFHLLDLRWKKDAQIEAQTLAAMLFESAESWIPELCEWYANNRQGKARLAP